MTRIRTGRALSLVSATMVVIAGCGDGGKEDQGASRFQARFQTFYREVGDDVFGACRLTV